MKRRLTNIAIMTVLLLSLAGGLATAVLPAPPALATDYYVVPGQSLQQVIDAVSAGDTVYVHDGVYNGNIIINKSLMILSVNGSAATVINASGSDGFRAVYINASNVVFGDAGHGFTVNGSGETGIGLWTEGGNELSGNIIRGNTVQGFDYGIDLYDSGGGAVRGNVIEGNEVHDCGSGIDLYSVSGTSVYGNTIRNNTAYDCGSGIFMYSNGSVYDNTAYNNEVYNCTEGILLQSAEGELNGSMISGNTVYNCTADGIKLWNSGNGSIHGNTVKGNTVYGCVNGINLDPPVAGNYDNYIWHNITYDPATLTGNDYGIVITDGCSYIYVAGNDIGYSAVAGLYIDNSDSILVTANSIHDNGDGIWVDFNSVYIYSNDIRNNTGYGIYLEDMTYADVSCNNIVGNGRGLGSYASSSVDIYYNWWGHGGAPIPDADIWGDPKNGTETYLSYEHTINTAAVPATISLADMLFYDDDILYIANRNSDYSTGPAYADLIVEGYHGEACCNASSAYVDLSVLLLDLLPADFEQRYVSTWDSTNQSAWESWMGSLGETGMTYYSGLGGIWDYDLKLQELLVYGSPDLYDFFGYEGGEDDWARLIHEEMRPGDFMVPAYISTTCGVYITTFVPLTVVDYQLPLKGGWNVRSVPATLDEDRDTWGDIMNTGDGLPGLEALITYNASTGSWEEPGLGGVPEPLSAYFIKMSAEDQLGFIISREETDAPERQLYAGWNLVSSAPAEDYEPATEYHPYNIPFPEMWTYDALVSVEEAPGGLPGWQTAMNLPEYLQYREYFYWDGSSLCYNGPEKPWYDKYFEQDVWTALSSETWWGWAGEPMLLPGGGYWLYMTNPAVLEGYSTTPYYWWPEIEWYEP